MFVGGLSLPTLVWVHRPTTSTPTCTLHILWLCFHVSVVHTNVHTMAHLNVHFINMVRVRGTNGVCREDPSEEIQLRKCCGCVTRG